mgnify:CR=1 FL=1
MLNSINLNDKTYDELLMEAIAQIPMYSREWTNYNTSDPGITLLQNLTAFQMLQQETINKVPGEVRRKLLKLVGYTARENQAATVLLQAPTEGGAILPMGHLLWSGEIPFETTQEIQLLPWGLAAVYGEVEGTYRDLSRLLRSGTDTKAYPFGRSPVAGNALIFVLHGVPEMGEPVRLWLQVAQEELRTPFLDESEIPPFSRVRWQYYTAAGWKNVRFEDETIGMLRSGQVTLWLEGDLPEELTDTPIKGCALRCLLETSDFDRTPRLHSAAVHLFPVKQQHTRVQCIDCPGAQTVTLRERLAQGEHIMVFCQEEENGAYYLYQERGYYRTQRVYDREDELWSVKLKFDRIPFEGEHAIKVVCFDEEMIHHRILGTVHGYDGQILAVDLVNNILPEQFLLAVEEMDEDGTAKYCFVAPEEKGPDGFCYHVRSQQAQVVIDNPGRGGYRLFLVSCAVTQGIRGNVHSDTVLEQLGGYDGTEVEMRYVSPAPGRGGMSYESAEELRLRFSAEMQKTHVAVRIEDYEELVKNTPGLCIHKVKAVAIRNKNLVKIAIKPYTEEELPKLSKEYLRQIQTFLEPHRMLTTRFELCSPRYVPIGVRATVSVRGMASYAKEEIEKLIRETLDYVNGAQRFGEWVRFNMLYQKISSLPFVEGVDALNLFPESRDAVLEGSDIRVEDDSLCYPGTIQLIIREHGR